VPDLTPTLTDPAAGFCRRCGLHLATAACVSCSAAACCRLCAAALADPLCGECNDALDHVLREDD
jgi:hypothetical protein